MLAAGSAWAQSTAPPPALKPPPPLRAIHAPAPPLRLPEFVLRKRLLAAPLMTRSQAWRAMKRAYPRARVLSIRDGLRQHEFLVTLRMGSRLLRVRLDRRSGAIRA
jgi:hypothetical protein